MVLLYIWLVRAKLKCPGSAKRNCRFSPKTEHWLAGVVRRIELGMDEQAGLEANRSFD